MMSREHGMVYRQNNRFFEWLDSAYSITRLYIHFDEFFAIDADNRDCFVPG